MLRYRFRRDVGHRDGDAMIAPYVTAGAPWWCACGSENDQDDSFCWWCKAPMGSWMCGCGHRNKKGATACETCGGAAPEHD